MKTRIIEIITKKINEHKSEIEIIKEQSKDTVKILTSEAIKEVIMLKDKLLFHTAAAFILEDLLKELDNV